MYLFLAAVSDQRGLSFYSDTSTAIRLRMSEQAVVAARDELTAEDLVAYRSPLTQVLSLPQATRRRRGGSGVAGRNVPRPGPSHGFHGEAAMKVSLWAEIRRLHEVEGLSQAAIARRLHCCTGPFARHWPWRRLPRPRREPQENVLDPYHAQIDVLLAKYPDLSAVRVLEEIARGEDGYRGSVYPVRRYLHKIRPARGRVYQEVIYEPGEAMQVDWGDCGRLMIGQTPRRVSVFVAVLCYSRMCYIEFSLSQQKADFYRALVHALEFFQGSPRKVIFDNLKAAVISGGAPRLSASRVLGPLRPLLPGTDRLRGPRPGIERNRGGRSAICQAQCPGGPQRGVGHWEDYRRLAPRWRDEVANVRLHAATRNAPSTVFRRNATGSVPCRPCRSIATRLFPSSSRPLPGCVMTATATPCRRGWYASRSRCGPTPARCGLSIKARKSRDTRAAMKKAA